MDEEPPLGNATANANSVMLLPEGSQVPGGVERLLVAPASDQGNMAFYADLPDFKYCRCAYGMNNILIFIPTIKKPLVSIEGAFAFEES